MPSIQQVKTVIPRTRVLLAATERLAVVRKLRGIWKNRKPDPIKELARMRKEWSRKA